MEGTKNKPMTGAERIRKYREKKKNDIKYKASESMRISNFQKSKVKKMSQSEYRDFRIDKTEYLKQWRAKKRTTPVLKVKVGGFNCKHTLAKAVKRLETNCPLSPQKRIEAIIELQRRNGAELPTKEKARSSTALSLEHCEIVKSFYFNPSVVYTSPALKDEMTHWNNGKKEKLRKYYLTMTLKEAFAVFQEYHPDVEIGFTLFTTMRPVNVILMKDSPLD